MAKEKKSNNKKLIILGWDGATFSVLDKMMKSGVMPILKETIKNGVRSELLCTIPPITGPSWTSFRTGKKPENHGLYSFFKSQEKSVRPEDSERHNAKSSG